MAPKKRRQHVGTLNYQKRKDITGKARPEDGGMESGASRVEGGIGSGVSRVEGGGDSRVEGGGDSRVEGGMESDDSRVEGRIGSEELDEGEQGSSSYSNVEELVTKRPRLSEIGAMAEEPVQSWLDHLPRDDLQLLLYARLPTVFGVQKTDTAVVVGKVLDKSERTIRRWVDDFVSNGGEFSDSRQGHYIRINTLMTNEDLCERARVYVRENAAQRGRPNLTASSFCHWVNNELLPNSVLEPGYPHRVSVETARKWLHELGFEIL